MKYMAMSVLLAFLYTGCGDSSSETRDTTVQAVKKPFNTCRLIEKKEAEHLAGKALTEGKLSDSPSPGVRICTWSMDTGAPEVILTYYPKKKYPLKSYAVPDYEIENLDSGAHEAIAVWTPKDSKLQEHQILAEVIVDADGSVLNLLVRSAEAAKGSEKAKEMISLAQKAAGRVK